MANVGKLNVVLDASTGKFSKKLSKANSQVEGLGSKSGKAGAGVSKLGSLASVAAGGVAAVATAAVAAGAGLAALTVKVSEIGDEIDKTSQKAGVTTDALQELRHAADLSGVSSSNLTKALQKTSQNAEKAAKGTGKAAEAYDELGISVTDADGNLKESDQLMSEVADRFQGMDDGATKTALAMKMFGTSGTELIPMLNEGSASINEMRQDAHELGNVMSGDAVKNAADFQDAMSRLKALTSGLANSVGSTLIPAATRLIETFTSVAQAMSKALPAGEGLQDMLVQIVDNGMKFLIEYLADAYQKTSEFYGILKKGAPFISAVAKILLATGKALKIVGQSAMVVNNVVLGLVSGALGGLIKGLVAVQRGAANLARATGADGLAKALEFGADAGEGLGDMLVGLGKNRAKAAKDGVSDLGDSVSNLDKGFDGLSAENIEGGLNSVKNKADAASKALRELNKAAGSTYNGYYYTPDPGEQGPVGPVRDPNKDYSKDKKPSTTSTTSSTPAQTGKTQAQKNELFAREIEILEEKDAVQKAILARRKEVRRLDMEGITGEERALAILRKQLEVDKAREAAKKAQATDKGAAQEEEGGEDEEKMYARLNNMKEMSALEIAKQERDELQNQLIKDNVGLEEYQYKMAEAKLRVKEEENKEQKELNEKQQETYDNIQSNIDAVGGMIGGLGEAVGMSDELIGALQGAAGAASSAAGALADFTSKDYFQAALGGISAVGSLLGGLFGLGGDDDEEEEKSVFDREKALEDQAKKFAKAFADEQEKRLGRPVEINVDARGALVGEENEVARSLTDLVEGEMSNRVGRGGLSYG